MYSKKIQKVVIIVFIGIFTTGIVTYLLTLPNYKISSKYLSQCDTNDFTEDLNIVDRPYSENSSFHDFGTIYFQDNKTYLEDYKGQVIILTGDKTLDLKGIYSDKLIEINGEFIKPYSSFIKEVEVHNYSLIPNTVLIGFVSNETTFNGVAVHLIFMKTVNKGSLYKFILEGPPDIEKYLLENGNKLIKIAGTVRSRNSSANFFAGTQKLIPTFSVRFICK